ncbi:MAG: hypothetical protein WC570_03995 [Patescibacteria group bacterium]
MLEQLVKYDASERLLPELVIDDNEIMLGQTVVVDQNEESMKYHLSPQSIKLSDVEISNFIRQANNFYLFFLKESDGNCHHWKKCYINFFRENNDYCQYIANVVQKHWQTKDPRTFKSMYKFLLPIGRFLFDAYHKMLPYADNDRTKLIS